MPARTPPSKAPEAAPPSATPASVPAVRRYRVLSGGISTIGGAHYRGAVLTAEQIGDAARVAQLRSKGAIEEIRNGG